MEKDSKIDQEKEIKVEPSIPDEPAGKKDPEEGILNHEKPASPVAIPHAEMHGKEDDRDRPPREEIIEQESDIEPSSSTPMAPLSEDNEPPEEIHAEGGE